MKIALSSCKNSRIVNWPNRELSDLEYADDGGLPSDDSSKLLVFLNLLNGNVSMFGVYFAPSKCKMLLEDWISSKSNIGLKGNNSAR